MMQMIADNAAYIMTVVSLVILILASVTLGSLQPKKDSDSKVKDAYNSNVIVLIVAIVGLLFGGFMVYQKHFGAPKVAAFGRFGEL